MSHLDYLNENEWKKLGTITFITFFTLQSFLTLVYLIFDWGLEVIIYRKFYLVSVIYAFCFSIISSLFFYAKGENQWKKLGIKALLVFFTLQYILTLFCLFFYGVPKVGVYKNFFFASAIYSFCYSIISFLFLYAKGEKVFRLLIAINFCTPVVLILYGVLFLIFGPHG